MHVILKTPVEVHGKIKQWLRWLPTEDHMTAVDQGLSGGLRGSYKADRGTVLTRSCCFGLHTRLGSDFFPTDTDSDNDCW